MATTSDFTCPNGHPFKAVAKLRARCPKCGAMARMQFGNLTQKKPENPTTNISPTPMKPAGDQKPSKYSEHIKPKVVYNNPLASGSKDVSTSKKVEPQSSEINGTLESPTSTRKSATIVKQGSPRTPPLKRQPPPKISSAKSSPSTKGIVTHKKVSPGYVPTVKRMPKGSRERKVAEQLGEGDVYQVKVMKKFGFHR